MRKRIQVLAAEDQDTLDRLGAKVEFDFDTIKEAKKRARYYLSVDYMHVCESSTQLGYSQVLVNGECVADYFGENA